MIKRFLSYWPLWLIIAVVSCVIYAICNLLNPDSRFCMYKIYKQPDGAYEVWFQSKHTDTREGSFATLEAAKDFQKQKCDSLKEYMMNNHPKGKRVK